MAIQVKGPRKSVSKPRVWRIELFHLRCRLINIDPFDPPLDAIGLHRSRGTVLATLEWCAIVIIFYAL
jgi:hypothetical protein